jgi:hypothetical protein
VFTSAIKLSCWSVPPLSASLGQRGGETVREKGVGGRSDATCAVGDPSDLHNLVADLFLGIRGASEVGFASGPRLSCSRCQTNSATSESRSIPVQHIP